VFTVRRSERLDEKPQAAREFLRLRARMRDSKVHVVVPADVDERSRVLEPAPTFLPQYPADNLADLS
jgi:hypothetical protein